MSPDDPSPPAEGRLRAFARRYGVALLLVLAFGLARLPVETGLSNERQASIGRVKLDLSLRAKVTQSEFLAALSGFRSLVADLLWVEAHTAWERVEYGRMNLLFSTVTTLVPHNVLFWDMSSWHMAYNGSVAAMDDRKEPNIGRRRKNQREYFELGKQYAENGIKNNPQSPTLWHSLGEIYRRKFEDHYQASLAFERAAACPHAPSYEKRFAAFELALCPGREEEAYHRLRALYDLGPQERVPTLEKDLADLEEKLHIPVEQRIYKPR